MITINPLSNNPGAIQAFANACEALDLHLESLQKLSQPYPQPKHRLVVREVG